MMNEKRRKELFKFAEELRDDGALVGCLLSADNYEYVKRDEIEYFHYTYDGVRWFSVYDDGYGAYAFSVNCTFTNSKAQGQQLEDQIILSLGWAHKFKDVIFPGKPLNPMEDPVSLSLGWVPFYMYKSEGFPEGYHA